MIPDNWIWGLRDHGSVLHLGPVTLVWGANARLWVPGNYYTHRIKAYGAIAGRVALVVQLGQGKVRADTQTGAAQEV